MPTAWPELIFMPNFSPASFGSATRSSAADLSAVMAWGHERHECSPIRDRATAQAKRFCTQHRVCKLRTCTSRATRTVRLGALPQSLRRLERVASGAFATATPRLRAPVAAALRGPRAGRPQASNRYVDSFHEALRWRTEVAQEDSRLTSCEFSVTLKLSLHPAFSAVWMNLR